MRRILNKVLAVVINSKAEVIFLFFSLAYSMPTAFIQNLIIQKLCLRRNYSRDYCLSDTINKTLDDTMQAEASQLLLYYNLLRQLPAIIFTLFVGQWCDKYGRKYVMIIPLVSCAISSMLYFVNAWFIDWPPIYLIVSAIPAGLGGGRVAFNLGIYGFIRDIHPMKSLSVRLSTVDGADGVAKQIGPFLGGQLYLHFGAKGVFLMCVAMLMVGLIFTALFVKDDKFKKEVDTRVVLKDLFDGRGFISSVVAVFKNRDGHFRAYILCILICMFVHIMADDGVTEILYLYTRLTVKWNVSTLNFYNSLRGTTSALGSLILLPLLVQVFHWSDSTLGLIGLVANVVHCYMLILAKKSGTFYGAVSLKLFARFCTVSFRSTVSKCIAFSEWGKVMAVYAVLESVAINVGQVVATQLYARTYTFFPGAFFVFAGSVSLISVALYTWIFVDLRKNRIVLEEVYEEVKANNSDANS